MNNAKERARAVWNAGDYSPTSQQLEPASVALVEALGVSPGDYLLDVAAGDGNCAIAAASRGARVVATDFADTMIARGRARSRTLGLDIEWSQTDAESLDFDDGRFDIVTSVFGAIFTGDQTSTASELMRVTRPGGVVGLAAWTPDGYTGELLRAVRSFAPASSMDPPPADPLRWGTDEGIDELLGHLAADIRIERKVVTFSYPSWDAMLRAQEAHGYAVIARRTMAPDTYEELRSVLNDIARRHDRGQGGSVVYDAPYLETVARKKVPVTPGH